MDELDFKDSRASPPSLLRTTLQFDSARPKPYSRSKSAVSRPSAPSPATQERRNYFTHRKMSYAFGSSTPREFSYLDHVPLQYRVYNVRLRSRRRKGDPSLKDYLRELHASPSRRPRDLSVDSSLARIYAFGSCTPRELSYLDKVARDLRVYDVRLRPAAAIDQQKRSKTTSFSSPGGGHPSQRYARRSSSMENVQKEKRAKSAQRPPQAQVVHKPRPVTKSKPAKKPSPPPMAGMVVAPAAGDMQFEIDMVGNEYVPSHSSHEYTNSQVTESGLNGGTAGVGEKYVTVTTVTTTETTSNHTKVVPQSFSDRLTNFVQESKEAIKDVFTHDDLQQVTAEEEDSPAKEAEPELEPEPQVALSPPQSQHEVEEELVPEPVLLTQSHYEVHRNEPETVIETEPVPQPPQSPEYAHEPEHETPVSAHEEYEPQPNSTIQHHEEYETVAEPETHQNHHKEYEVESEPLQLNIQETAVDHQQSPTDLVTSEERFRNFVDEKVDGVHESVEQGETSPSQTLIGAVTEGLTDFVQESIDRATDFVHDTVHSENHQQSQPESHETEDDPHGSPEPQHKPPAEPKSRESSPTRDECEDEVAAELHRFQQASALEYAENSASASIHDHSSLSDAGSTTALNEPANSDIVHESDVEPSVQVHEDLVADKADAESADIEEDNVPDIIVESAVIQEQVMNASHIRNDISDSEDQQRETEGESERDIQVESDSSVVNERSSADEQESELSQSESGINISDDVHEVRQPVFVHDDARTVEDVGSEEHFEQVHMQQSYATYEENTAATPEENHSHSHIEDTRSETSEASMREYNVEEVENNNRNTIAEVEENIGIQENIEQHVDVEESSSSGGFFRGLAGKMHEFVDAAVDKVEDLVEKNITNHDDNKVEEEKQPEIEYDGPEVDEQFDMKITTVNSALEVDDTHTTPATTPRSMDTSDQEDESHMQQEQLVSNVDEVLEMKSNVMMESMGDMNGNGEVVSSDVILDNTTIKINSFEVDEHPAEESY